MASRLLKWLGLRSFSMTELRGVSANHRLDLTGEAPAGQPER